MIVYIEECNSYDLEKIREVLLRWWPIFFQEIKPGDAVIIKPNWISEAHKYNNKEWVQIITNPNIITCVLELVLKALDGTGRVVITDGPQTSSIWKKIMEKMEPELWEKMGKKENIDVSILDLRDNEWITKGEIIIERKDLPGDPLGSSICNLKSNSEFLGKETFKSQYFGADYNKSETNTAHSNGNHFYKVSRTVVEADVFINLPKLKTHKKAGITCSLKNLVGINTYKNWLPHYTEGTPSEGGDQFPEKSFRSLTEGSLTRALYEILDKNPNLARFFIPVKKAGKLIFGDTRKKIRSGSWHGNDTLWRTVLDLNKILMYANGDGGLREAVPESKKRYISIVDAVVSGEGNGPDASDRKDTGLIILGTDPISVDAVCAKMMGFDWKKIPTIKNSFRIKKYPICEFGYNDIKIESSIEKFNKFLKEIDNGDTFNFTPSIGWSGNIEEKI